MLAIQHPKLQQLFDYWSAKRGGREMPSRADIDPLDLAFVIGNVAAHRIGAHVFQEHHSRSDGEFRRLIHNHPANRA